jgi:hypothetical protein
VEISNLTGLGKPLEKLVEVCAQGIGAIARPWLITRDARALAEARSILATGGLPASLQDGSVPLPELLKSHVEYREAKRLENVRGVFEEARKVLPDAVSDEQVDPDWTVRFFEYVQDVSRREMQELWGKLLAGEVSRPRSFGLRTIEVVRSLSIEEAVAFGALARVVFHEGIEFYIPPQVTEMVFIIAKDQKILSPKSMGLPSLYEARGLGRQMFARLTEAGLVVFQDDLMGSARAFSTPADVTGFVQRLPVGRRVLVIEGHAPNVKLVFPAHPLTPAGSELLEICSGPADTEFEQIVVAELARLDFTARLEDRPLGSGSRA